MNKVKKAKYVSIISLISITAFVFYPVLFHDFQLHWDDGWQVFNDFTYNGVTIENIKEIFSKPYMGQYSPLNQLVYSCINQAFGMRAFFFHLLSLILHIGSVLLTFLFINRLLCLYGESAFAKRNIISWLTAVCIAIHPVQVESVAWISASKVLMFSFFFLLGLTIYTHYVVKPTIAKYLSILLAFSCSFFCKEQGVVFPFCLLLIDWLINRPLRRRALLVEKVPFFLFALLFCMVTLVSYNSSIMDITGGAYTVLQRIVFMGYSLIEYIMKLCVPIQLLYVYPFPMPAGGELPVRFYLFLIVLPALFYLLRIGRKKRIYIFGALFFLIQLILVLHILPMPRATIVADRYLYLASIGFFFPLIWVGVNYSMSSKRYRKVLPALCLLILICLGTYSNIHCQIWIDSGTLKKELKEILDARELGR